jgi:hypothetical protein
MPRLDADIPKGALLPSAERELLAKVTDPVAPSTRTSTQQREGPTARLGFVQRCWM